MTEDNTTISYQYIINTYNYGELDKTLARNLEI